MITSGAVGNIIFPLAGVVFSASVLSGFDLSWLIEPRHALAVGLGVIGGFLFQLYVSVHPDTPRQLRTRHVVLSHLIVAIPNFLLAAGLTSTFAGSEPPKYLLIVVASLLIAASGGTAIQFASPAFIQRVWGGERKDEKP